MLKRVRRKEGQIVEVPLGEGASAVAIVLKEPLVAFFDKIFDQAIDTSAVDSLPTAFTLMVIPGVFLYIKKYPLLPHTMSARRSQVNARV